MIGRRAELFKLSHALCSGRDTVVDALERRFYRRAAGLGVRRSIPSSSEWQLMDMWHFKFQKWKLHDFYFMQTEPRTVYVQQGQSNLAAGQISVWTKQGRKAQPSRAEARSPLHERTSTSKGTSFHSPGRVEPHYKASPLHHRNVNWIRSPCHSTTL